ncbi:hypothetical protein GRX01_09355 [Halobaculum sp. WSA2]|uniref:Small CPxCG-related zinc finger protein n=1 Tax=Halobaculum saliterrae TaxID=2073113 RepID=A0A6B0SY28_9EURY|nr:hypothetical protein [Halobaculum saliterrae]MXR41543.1 hypothetical protein [Halobaculum saliterrae]
MGLFNELGRRVEEFKQTAQDAADEREAHHCPACDEGFDGDHDRCPECGERMVESTGMEE